MSSIHLSPEEYAYEPETEKVDVYSLGNVLYFLLTRRFPWKNVKADDVYEAVMNGERPPIPKAILRSDDPFYKYTLRGINMCYEQNPRKRASAREVAEAIAEGFDKF